MFKHPDTNLPWRAAWLAATAVCGATALGLTAVPASAAPRVFAGSDNLLAVAASGPADAWAVGGYFITGTSGETELPLIEHWNGRKWRLVKSPAVGSQGGYLHGVAIVSAKNAWAVGAAKGGALIEHWNGTTWRVIAAAPVPGKNPGTTLTAVAAVSAKSVWAVGSRYKGTGIVPLIEHWNGRKWAVVPSPDPNGIAADDYLNGVAATKSGAWAVGSSAPGNIYQTLVLSLTHGKWVKVTSPNPSGLGNWLGAVSAAGTHVLAAGFGGYDNPGIARTLVAHKIGQVFKLDTTANPGPPAKQDELYGVAATPDGGWAVGRATTQTLILREQSGHWHTVASPSWPSPDTSILEGAGTSGHTAWAVGQYNIGSVSYSLILRWTGKKWVQVASPNR